MEDKKLCMKLDCQSEPEFWPIVKVWAKGDSRYHKPELCALEFNTLHLCKDHATVLGFKDLFTEKSWKDLEDEVAKNTKKKPNKHVKIEWKGL